jgi:hypothetical protein
MGLLTRIKKKWRSFVKHPIIHYPLACGKTSIFIIGPIVSSITFLAALSVFLSKSDSAGAFNGLIDSWDHVPIVDIGFYHECPSDYTRVEFSRFYPIKNSAPSITTSNRQFNKLLPRDESENCRCTNGIVRGPCPCTFGSKTPEQSILYWTTHQMDLCMKISTIKRAGERTDVSSGDALSNTTLDGTTFSHIRDHDYIVGIDMVRFELGSDGTLNKTFEKEKEYPFHSIRRHTILSLSEDQLFAYNNISSEFKIINRNVSYELSFIKESRWDDICSIARTDVYNQRSAISLIHVFTSIVFYLSLTVCLLSSCFFPLVLIITGKLHGIWLPNRTLLCKPQQEKVHHTVLSWVSIGKTMISFMVSIIEFITSLIISIISIKEKSFFQQIGSTTCSDPEVNRMLSIVTASISGAIGYIAAVMTCVAAIKLIIGCTKILVTVVTNIKKCRKKQPTETPHTPENNIQKPVPAVMQAISAPIPIPVSYYYGRQQVYVVSAQSQNLPPPQRPKHPPPNDPMGSCTSSCSFETVTDQTYITDSE